MRLYVSAQQPGEGLPRGVVIEEEEWGAKYAQGEFDEALDEQCGRTRVCWWHVAKCL